MERIIIDTDPGTDDAFAIILAAKEENIHIEGITTVNGNCSLENATNNALNLIDMLDMNNVEVYQGSDKSLTLNRNDATDVHGNNGMGGVSLPNLMDRVNQDKSAIDYLVETVNNNPKEITIVAIGPLTNIALAIQKDVNFAKNIKSLVIMGGGKDVGNITPWAEFNFYIDGKAANIVLNSGIEDIVIIPLNVTEKNILTQERENQLLSLDNEIAKFLYDITRASAKFDMEKGFEGACMHDPVTIAYLIDRKIVKLYDFHIDVITEGEMEGKCVFDDTKQNNCKMALEIDSDKFFDKFFEKVF